MKNVFFMGETICSAGLRYSPYDVSHFRTYNRRLCVQITPKAGENVTKNGENVTRSL